MSHNIFLRMAHREDAPQIIDWWVRAGHAEDPRVLLERSSEVFCAHNHKPILFMPTRLVSVIDGLATNPESTDGERALALREAVHGLALLAQRGGVQELWYMSGHNDGKIDSLACKAGFEEVPWKVFRLRL